MDATSGMSNQYASSLVHGEPLSLRADNVARVFRQLWYSPSTQAYIQRDTAFDGTVFDRASTSFHPIADECAKVLLSVHLGLEHIKVYKEHASELERELPIVSYEKPVLLLHTPRGKVSVLNSFYEKLRNSIAHGTFNRLPQVGYRFIGQFRAKPESPINFYLQIKGLEQLDVLNRSMSQLCVDDILLLMKKTYATVHPIHRIDGRLYKCSDNGGFVYFDDSFKFTGVKDGESQEGQVRRRLEGIIEDIRFGEMGSLNYVIAEASNSAFRSINSKYPNIHIIHRGIFARHLGVREWATTQD